MRTLDQINKLVPWDRLTSAILKLGKGHSIASRSHLITPLLKVYFIQNWFLISNSEIDYFLEDSCSFRKFVLGREGKFPMPKGEIIRQFRSFMESSGIGERMIHNIDEYLAIKNLKLVRGMVVSAKLERRDTGNQL